MAEPTLKVDLTLQELRELLQSQLVATGKHYFMAKPADVLRSLERLVELQKAVVSASNRAASNPAKS